jgi:hypothetical protein
MAEAFIKCTKVRVNVNLTRERGCLVIDIPTHQLLSSLKKSFEILFLLGLRKVFLGSFKGDWLNFKSGGFSEKNIF